jgi:hypothetical protein
LIKFLKAKEIWPRITTLAKKTKRSHVAVAYFGQEARRLLPLGAGSILVVDCHRRSVRGGRTCPHDLLALIKNKVEIHSCSNLHAKVFVFGKRAIIGSNNASNLSKNYLMEAAVETTDEDTVAACKEFVNGLRGDQVLAKYAEKLCKIWNPPKIFGPKSSADLTPRFHPLWVVPLIREEWDEIDDKKDKEAEPVAKSKLKNRRRFKLEKFQWKGDDPLSKSIKKGHQIIQAIEEAATHHLYRPARVIYLKRYRKNGKPQMIVYVETPRAKPEWRSIETVRAALGPLKQKLVVKHAARKIRDPKMAHILFQLWPGQKLD